MIVMKYQCAEFQIPVGLGNTGQRAYLLLNPLIITTTIIITIIIIIYYYYYL